MTNPDDPAFPVEKISYISGHIYPEGYKGGLTKREEFAAMAMNSFTDIIMEAQGTTTEQMIERIAELSARLADALIAALNKEPK